MKSLRLQNVHYFRNGYISFPSINKAKANGYGIGGTGVIHDKPTAYSVFSLDDVFLSAHEVGRVHSYPPDFRAQLDQLQEIADKLEAVS